MRYRRAKNGFRNVKQETYFLNTGGKSNVRIFTKIVAHELKISFSTKIWMKNKCFNINYELIIHISKNHEKKRCWVFFQPVNHKIRRI